jgi:hypothetical protein
MRRATTGLGRAKTLLRQPWARQRLIGEATRELLVARLSIRRRGQFGALDALGLRTTDLQEAAVGGDVGDVGWSVAAAARTLPWNTECLTQAIAAARMLARRQVPWRIHIGLGRDDDGLIGHAWVTSGRKTVVGGGSVTEYARLVAYAPRVGA